MEHPDERPNAEDLYARWLADRERGGAPALDELCRLHPEHADELRSLAEDERVVDRDFAGLAAGRIGPLDDGGHGFAIGSEPHERYRREGELGRGGMGVVERAWDRRLRRPLAMKVLRAPTTTGGRTKSELLEAHRRRRFQNEVRITANLDHPGVAPLYDVGIDESERVYFTMRLVEGSSFDVVVEHVHAGREGWTLTRALNVLLRVCETVGYAHERGIVHRDLKPANLMVGRFGEAYVMDWGVARRVDDPEEPAAKVATAGEEGVELLTLEGDVLGTPAYMPPEQARGELARIGPASDVYALGATLYHLLAGHPPYVEPGAGSTTKPGEVLRALRAGPPVAIAHEAPDVPVELCAICERAMEREPARRYGSVMELAEELRAYLENRVVGAYRTGPLAELGKWIARNRAFAATLITVTVLIGAGSFATAGALAQKNTTIAGALRDAEHEADVASNVANFFREVLGECRPMFRGRDVTLIDAIDAHADRVDDAFAEAPEIAARVHATLGRIYGETGLSHRAEHHLRRSRALSRSLPRTAAVDTIRVQVTVDLSQTLAEAIRFDELEELLPEALAFVEEVEGPRSWKAFALRSHRAQMWFRQGRLEEARRVNEELLVDFADVDAERIPVYRAGILGSLAEVLSAQGEHEAAIAAAEEALALREAQSMKELGLCTTLVHLMRVKKAALAPEECLATAERALACWREHVVPSDPRLTSVEMELAELYEAAGRRTEALALTRGALERARPDAFSRPGLERQLRVLEVTADGRHYFSLGLERARERVQEALERDPDEGLGVQLARLDLARLLTLGYRYEEALPLVEAARAGLPRVGSPTTDAEHFVAADGLLGVCLSGLERCDEALPWLESALERAPDRWWLGNAARLAHENCRRARGR